MYGCNHSCSPQGRQRWWVMLTPIYKVSGVRVVTGFTDHLNVHSHLSAGELCSVRSFEVGSYKAVLFHASQTSSYKAILFHGSMTMSDDPRKSDTKCVLNLFSTEIIQFPVFRVGLAECSRPLHSYVSTFQTRTRRFKGLKLHNGRATVCYRCN